jgi:hypothetical protein
MKRFYLFFNRVNLTKIFIIFSFGFMSRFFVNYFSDVNVFVDYTNFISLAYYIFMSIFVVLVHELVSFFNLSISPNFSNKIILGYFDSTPSCPLSGNIVTSKDGIKDIKEIKVVSSLFMESELNNNNNNNSGVSSNSDCLDISIYGNSSSVGNGIDNSSISFRLSGDSDIIRMERKEKPIINNNLKPIFIPDSLNVPYITNHFMDVSSSGNNTPQDLLTPRTSLNIYDGDVLGSSQTITSLNTSNIYDTGNFYRTSLISDYTNETNHALLGPTDPNIPYIDYRLDGIRRNDDIQLFQYRSIGDIDLDYRRERIMGNVDEEIFLYESKKGLFNKVKLGWKYLDSKVISSISKVDSMYIKYYDVSRRHFYWSIWESNFNRFDSYKDFKKSWDPKTKIWKEITSQIKSDIHAEVENLIRINDPFKSKSINDRNNIYNILSSTVNKKKR